MKVVGHDISHALRYGGVTIGGWGGSAYYWNVPYTDETGKTATVGERILRDPNELEKFVAVNAAAIKQIAQKRNLPADQLAVALDAGSRAALPQELRNAIVNRVVENVTDNANLAGDPENIDGYVPAYNPDGDVVGWRKSLGMGRFQNVTDQNLIDQLTQRRQIRLDKGDDTSWAEDPAAQPANGANTHPKGGYNTVPQQPPAIYPLPGTFENNPYADASAPAMPAE